jgi:hypothetical protein
MNTLSDPGNLSANGASALRKRISDQVTNKNAVPEESQVRVLEMALASPASSSDMLLRRIGTLLLILVAGLLTVFGYYASSIFLMNHRRSRHL